MIRFKKKLKGLKTSSYPIADQDGPSCLIPTNEEIKEAETHWIKGNHLKQRLSIFLITGKTKGDPIHINQFGLFLDEGILRCCGRLNNSTLELNSKNPVLLPHDH